VRAGCASDSADLTVYSVNCSATIPDGTNPGTSR
jgi:hypothetical protein